MTDWSDIKKSLKSLSYKAAAGLLLSASFAAFILHNTIYGLTGIEEPFFFLLTFISALAGGIVGVVGFLRSNLK